MSEKSPVKSYCGGKPNYCTPEETDNVGACVTCGAPKSEWIVDGVNMTPDRVDETAKGEQEPVGTYQDVMQNMLALRHGSLEQMQAYDYLKNTPLYTAPPKRDSSSWVGLTDEERFGEHTKYLTRNEWALVIEAKLKEKNT